MHRNTFKTGIVLVWLLCSTIIEAAPINGGDAGERKRQIPYPSFDRIDYSKPKAYLTLFESMGNAERIREIAATLKRDHPEDTLRTIDRWISSNLSCDPNAPYRWRDFDEIAKSGVYGGCADHAIVFGSLARACNIPTVWVKTMDYDWIRDFQRYGRVGRWSGHVFLEVCINERWVLLDAQGMIVYDDYDRTSHFFPAGRYGYDKGGDPYELILSVRWDLWKRQTADYFDNFDIAQLPWFKRGRNILGDSVYIAADTPYWRWIQKRCRKLGYRIGPSFNGLFEKHIPESQGHYLMLTYLGNRLVLPKQYHDAYLPIPLSELKKRKQNDSHGTLRRTTSDGTRVILLFAEEEAGLQEEIDMLILTEEQVD